MPFEIFVWALLDKIDMIGGYPSTTFISVPVNKGGSLFPPDAAAIVRPLNILFRAAANLYCINKMPPAPKNATRLGWRFFRAKKSPAEAGDQANNCLT